MKLVPIKMKDGSTLYASNDYYKEKGIRKPVGLTEAFQIVEREGLRLPTVEEVDAIWENADIRLSPSYMKPGPEMTSESYAIEHDARINKQLREAGYKDWSDKLIAGHKKDIININPDSKKVAIYGWHRMSGKPVQPYSTVHHREYADYSHGLRLVKRVTETSESSDTQQPQKTPSQPQRSRPRTFERLVPRLGPSSRGRLAKLIERLLRWKK